MQRATIASGTAKAPLLTMNENDAHIFSGVLLQSTEPADYATAMLIHASTTSGTLPV